MSFNDDITNNGAMTSITIKHRGKEWRVDAALFTMNSGLALKAFCGETQTNVIAGNTLNVPADCDGVNEQTIDLMVDFFNAGGDEDAAAAFVRGGRISHRGKIWVDTIGRGTDALQQVRDFFVTARVFESPSMERMLGAAVAMFFNELMASKGRMHRSLGYYLYTCIITQGLGVAFDPCFGPVEALDAIKEDVDETVRAIVEDMVEHVARAVDGEVSGPVSRKRKAEEMRATASGCSLDDDPAEGPDPKRYKKETADEDMDIEELFASPYDDHQGPDGIAVPSPVHTDTEPLVEGHSIPSSASSDSTEAPSSKADRPAEQHATPASSAAAPESPPLTPCGLVEAADDDDTPRLPPYWAFPLPAHLPALRDAYLRLLWAHRFDLLNNHDFLLYLAAHPHLSAALLGHVRARGGLRAPRALVPGAWRAAGAGGLDLDALLLRAGEWPSFAAAVAAAEPEEFPACRLAMLNCDGWLAWAPSVERRMVHFWKGMAMSGGLGCLGTRKGARRGEGKCREAPY